MRRWWFLALLAACDDPAPPAPSTADVATSVTGTRFEIEKVPVAGKVTIVEFMAPW